jgi:hypothetical protein
MGVRPLSKRTWSKVRALFTRAFHEAEHRFVFEVRSPRLENDWLTFYIKPENGLELPAIMKWLKQTFAQRYNRETGRTGHIWSTHNGTRKRVDAPTAARCGPR